MARAYRIQIEDGFYHITSRGDDRKAIFRDDRDRSKLLEYIRSAVEKYKFYVHCYCLMSNHYHLLIETTQSNLSRLMQYINTSYTVYHNVKHKRSGHLFQGRYKSILVEEDAYFAELTRYIHLNPVRARIVDFPEKYPWSSYRCYASNKPDPLVDIERARGYLGIGVKSYVDFVKDGVKGCPNPLKNAYAGMILGGEKFIKDNLAMLKDEVEAKDFAYKRAFMNDIDPIEIISAVAGYFKVDPEVLKTSVTRPMTPKKAAIYLLRKKTGFTNEEIGAMFGMRASAISKAAGNFEKEMMENGELRKVMGEIVSTFEV